MANTYTQLYIQLVFAVKYRESLVKESFKDELEKYICGIISNNNVKPLAIFCMPDHTHILIGLNPKISISDLVRDIKSNSSLFINSKNWTPHQFKWQEGFGAFSYSRSALDNVIRYIQNQQEHHARRTFKDEYLEFLKTYGVEYNNDFLFEWL